MERRVRRILLVCNNYDNFVLNEDGRLDVQIAEEYTELNLSNPPSIVRVETEGAALEMVRQGKTFDLVITMSNTAVESTFDFAHEMKQLVPGTPVVLLTSFSKAVYERIRNAHPNHSLPNNDIDYTFCWNNSTRVR